MIWPPDLPIDLFHGQLSPQSAQVYARAVGLAGGGEWTLTGRVHGPHCHFAKTLPSSASLEDLGAGQSLLARATLTDPCCWSCELPATYRFTVELRRHARLMATRDGIFGMRNLGARGRSFYWESRRWVLRGVRREAVPESPWPTWREGSAVVVADCPEDSLCQDASGEGVLIVAGTEGADDEIEGQLRRLAQWPSVGVVVLAPSAGDVRHWRQVAPNLVLAHRLAGPADPIPEWAHAVVVEAFDLAAFAQRPDARNLPVIASRPIAAVDSLGAGRGQCDVLQRELAAIGDFAGYLV